jgi:DNA polymerase III epsilon subunit-like protein
MLSLFISRETKILALDCERIQTKKGERLARISIVNFYGNIVFDTLVKPWAKVTDYREWITGIKPDDLKHAPSYPKIAPIVRYSPQRKSCFLCRLKRSLMTKW